MRFRGSASLLILAALSCQAVPAQQISKLDRQRAEQILDLTVKEVKKHYYDSTLHGFDIDVRAKEAKTRIGNAQSLGQAFTAIGWTLDGLNDSHTYFIPPMHSVRTEYGWRMQMVGEKCFVTRVRPGSDAESKGLKAGDQVLEVNGFQLMRADYAKYEYVFNLLRPLPGLHVKVRSADGAQRELDVLSKQRQESSQLAFWDLGQILRDIDKESRPEYYEMGDEVLILKPKTFVLDDKQVNEILGKLHKKKGVLFDLRGNGGGSVDVLARLLGVFFDHEVKIGDRLGREQKKPQMTKTSKEPFAGKVVVLTDSHSASASELFARVLQLEKRGTVVGDRSAGLVMEARIFDYHPGAEEIVFFGLAITDADIRMTDGNSLEGRGVTPEELMLPSAQDLAAGRDPVLSRGAALLGVDISPEKAGSMFPYKWPRN
jgi:carboxyl-terminal processing protease